MRRPIYECRACGGYCTARTRRIDEEPVRCLYFLEFCDWVRIDKHKQKQLGEYENE